MQLTGSGVWGDPGDPAEANGPFVAERLIKQALHPYPDDLVIATKVGLTRPGPGAWVPDGRPAHLRDVAELSLANLGIERIDLLQLHRIDPKVSLDDQIGALKALQDGKIRHIGGSEVTVAQLEAASKIATIVTVQNLYNPTNRAGESPPRPRHSRRHRVHPLVPLATDALANQRRAVARLAERLGATPSQLALAWLLKRSPVMLPIPGTSSVAHLEEDVGAAQIELSDSDFEAISAGTD
jgi:pyridoxine 4-dehydrogenase